MARVNYKSLFRVKKSDRYHKVCIINGKMLKKQLGIKVFQSIHDIKSRFNLLTHLSNAPLLIPELFLLELTYRAPESAPAASTDAAVSLLTRFRLSADLYPESAGLMVIMLAPFLTGPTSSEYCGVSECTVSAVTGLSCDSSVSIPNWMTPENKKKANNKVIIV